MIQRMPRHGHHLKLVPEHGNHVTGRHALVYAFDSRVIRAVDQRTPAIAQFAKAANVVLVVMRDQDACQRQALSPQSVVDYRRISGIDNEGIRTVAMGDEPDVIVVEGGNGSDSQHGLLFKCG